MIIYDSSLHINGKSLCPGLLSVGWECIRSSFVKLHSSLTRSFVMMMGHSDIPLKQILLVNKLGICVSW
jgi:hypothetical protein